VHRAALFRFRRSALLALVVVAATGLTVAGCSVPKPLVTFFSGGQATSTLPADYCTVDLSSCQTANAVAKLRVPAGRPLQVSVAPEVAGTPWVVAFKYKQTGGQELQGRSAVFQPGQQYAYTLSLPSADQLESVQVDQGSIALSQDKNGYEFYARAVWLLTIGS
jgi:hypothetical protein